MPFTNRREFCAQLGALVTAGALPGFAKPPGTQWPNIVFVLCDDLGWGDLGCYNPRSAIPTPRADLLAREGMRWTDMHSSDAVCTPSRYSVLTGRYCWRTALKRDVLNGYSPSLIESGRMTVPSMLKTAGYYTAGVGKWHLGLGNEPKTDFSKPLHPGPTDAGFDYYFGIPASLDMPPYVYFENDRVVEQPTSSTPGSTARGAFWREGPMAPNFDFHQVLPTIINKAVQVIHDRASQPSQPFFLYVAMPSPHTPWMPLREYQGKSRAGEYGDYAAEGDEMLGKLLDAVEKNGFASNTLFIFTSDHGADWRLEDMAQYEHRANAAWRGQKADIWEGGHRIPFIARWPGHIRPGSVVEELGCSGDFMATTAAIVGANLPDNAAEDSFNLLPVMLGRNEGPVRDSLVSHSWDGMFCIREGDWKLEEGLGSGGWSSKPEQVDPAPGGPKGQLYDLSADPREEHNLYQERPDIVDHLSKLLERFQRQGYTRPR